MPIRCKLCYAKLSDDDEVDVDVVIALYKHCLKEHREELKWELHLVLAKPWDYIAREPHDL